MVPSTQINNLMVPSAKINNQKKNLSIEMTFDRKRRALRNVNLSAQYSISNGLVLPRSLHFTIVYCTETSMQPLRQAV